MLLGEGSRVGRSPPWGLGAGDSLAVGAPGIHCKEIDRGQVTFPPGTGERYLKLLVFCSVLSVLDI